MQPARHTAGENGRTQFSLVSLFELTAICSIIFALSMATGALSSIFLAMTAVALTIMHGPLALAMFAAASLAADFPAGETTDPTYLRQIFVIVLGISLSTWYRFFSTRRTAKRSDGKRRVDRLLANIANARAGRETE